MPLVMHVTLPFFTSCIIVLYSKFMTGENEIEWKYNLRIPFVLDGQAYGTDGRAAARIKTTADDTSTDKRQIPATMGGIWENCWTEIWSLFF